MMYLLLLLEYDIDAICMRLTFHEFHLNYVMQICFKI